MMSMLIALLLVQPSPQVAAPAATAAVRQTLDAEQDAFFTGKCAEVVTYWAEDFTMMVEGQPRATNRDQLRNLCDNVTKMMAAGRIPGGGSRPQILSRDIYMLSDDIAYEVTRRVAPNIGRSSVTKVLVRRDDGWKISHMHEAIAREEKAATP